MAKRIDEGQQYLKVMTTIDASLEKKHIDPGGQVLLFKTQKVLIPPGFEGFAEFMNNRLSQTEEKLDESTAQSKRLANSLEAIIPKFTEQSVDQENPDLVLACLPEGKKADVAIADGMTIAAETLYILSTGEIAARVGNDKMTASQMGVILRRLKIVGDSKFHHVKKHGNTLLQCYKPSVISEIYKRVANPQAYDLCPIEVAKIVNRLKPSEAIKP